MPIVSATSLKNSTELLQRKNRTRMNADDTDH